MPVDHWHQHNIVFTDRPTARRTVSESIGPALAAAERAGELRGWWFMNKQPWPLRYRATAPSPSIHHHLDTLVTEGVVDSHTTGIYEPETAAFGGGPAMETAHALFHVDCRNLLTYPFGPSRLGPRETAVVLAGAMMRAAGLDWYEQGDVWARYARLRPTGRPLPPGRRQRLLSAVRTLMTADAAALARTGGPLDGHLAWVAEFERAGATLRVLAASGQLTRGLRAIIAHHILFHANRAGLSTQDQHTLSHIAEEAVMGTDDRTAPAADDAMPADITSTASPSTGPAGANEAEALRHALVEQIRADGHARTPGVEEALRTVPRHLFVPNAPLTEAYANSPVHIKYAPDGTSISCASQPTIVALMLDQLDARPGDHVLELGTGTGYNAALIGHLVGATGHVTTMDVDADLVEGARAHLAAAGVDNVEVVLGDGALGHLLNAPYDRIIATVGAHAIPRAWLEQLAPAGRLVAPQRLKGSVSRSIVWERREGRWVSKGSAMNTFMPLRRGIADDERHMIPLSADGTVRLQAPAGVGADAEELAGVLEQPRTEVWTGMTVRAAESPEWMELFVSCALPSGVSGLIRMLFPPQAKGGLLTADPYPSSAAAFDKGTLAYLTRRPSHKTTAEGARLWEFGVAAHGPGAGDLAQSVAEAVRTWDRDYRSRAARFELHDRGTPLEQARPGYFVLDTPLNRVIVDFS